MVVEWKHSALELEANPRATFADLGSTPATNRISAKKKVQSLLDEKIKRVFSISDPGPLVLRYRLAILMMVE